MKPWFGWLRWINPVQYGFEGLMSNEFYDLEGLWADANRVEVVPS